MSDIRTSLQSFGAAKVRVTYCVEHDEDHHGRPTTAVYLETFCVNGEEVNCEKFLAADIFTEWEKAIGKEFESDATDRRDDARIAAFEDAREEVEA